jgi:hypothetical protein
MRVVCAGNCSRKSCGSLLQSRWIASNTTRCSASCQMWLDSSRITDVFRALTLAWTHSAHNVARSKSNTRVTGVCFGMKLCAGNNTHCTAGVTLGGGTNAWRTPKEQSSVKKTARLFLSRAVFPGIKLVGRGDAWIAYAALETTGRTKSMRSMVAATPYSAAPSPGSSETRKALALARTSTVVPRSLSAGSEKVSSRLAPWSIGT